VPDPIAATTTAPDLSSAMHVADTLAPSTLDATSQPDAQASVTDPIAATTAAPDLSSASHVADTLAPSTLDATSQPDTIQALVSDLQPKATTTGEPAAQLNYAVEPSGPMQAFDHQAQHDLEAGMSDGSIGIVGIDVHHTATALA
jgi:hypothetical protein